MSDNAASPNVDVILDGAEVPDGHFLSYVVERDMYQADMAAIMLANQNDLYSTLAIGASVKIDVGNDKKCIYLGEVVGLEPVYKGGDRSKILIRAMNPLHRLLRKRKSMTFTDKSDEQILKQVVGDAGLTLEWKHEKSITYKHVYQHNQTDMEFLRTRAARMGCHVWCVDKKVFVKQPELQGAASAELNVDQSSPSGALRMFAPRLNSSGIVNKVTCKGWNPETKELIVGTAESSGSSLGSQNASSGAGSGGEEESFTVDHPIWSKQEADAIAKAKLQEASLSFMTGQAEVQGDAKLDIGKIVKIKSNPDSDAETKPADDPFNGKYYIMGLTHKFLPAGKDPFTTILRLARDAQKE